MKKFFLLLVFCLSLFAIEGLMAQPTFSMPCPLEVNQGDQICVPVRFEDFSNLYVVQFTLEWDEDVLQFDRVQGLNPNVMFLDPTDFDASNANNGLLGVDWGVPLPPTGFGVTRPDDEVFFEVCFTVLGTRGNFSDIAITDGTNPIYVTRQNAYPLNIGLFNEDGCASIATPPVVFNFPFTNANDGELACVDVTVENFENINTIQLLIRWNTTLFDLESFDALSANLPGFTNSGVAYNAAGEYIILSYFNANPNGVSIPDDTPILTLCFRVNGNCGQAAPIFFADEPTLSLNETTKSFNGMISEVGNITNNGQITVNCNDPNGLGVCLQDEAGCPGETVCIPVTTENFEDIQHMRYSVNWNEDVLEFQSVSVVASVFNFNAASFNTTQTTQGKLGVNYSDFTCFGQDVPDGDVLFEMCFKIIGGAGTTTPITITDDPQSISISDQCGPAAPNNIGINTCNAIVDICDVTGVTLSTTTFQEDFPGTSVCYPVRVQDFRNIRDLAFSFNWDNNSLQFTGINGPFGVAGFTAANIDLTNTNNGNICVDWSSGAANGNTVPNNTVLFEICFEVIGDANSGGGCSDLQFTNLPCPISASNNVVSNLPVNTTSGEFCVKNPVAFGMNVNQTFTPPGATSCVEFTVDNFIDITNLQFTVTWDPNVATFDNITDLGTLAGFGPGSYTVVNGNTVTFDYQAPTGENVPSGTAIFELCLEATGNGGDCTSVLITDAPQSILVTSVASGTTNLGIINEDGNFCINNGIFFVDTMTTNVSCPNQMDGAISMELTGGSGNYVFDWTGPGTFSASTEDLAGLNPGQYCVNIRDRDNAGFVAFQCFTIRINGAAPIANAGTDIQLNCGQVTFMLDGSGSSSGNQISYLWDVINGSGGFMDAAVQNPMAIGPDRYFIAVTDQSTGCTARDTVFVNRAIAPPADAGPPDTLTCLQDTVTLQGVNPFGSNMTFLWTSPDSAEIVPGTERTLTPVIIGGGTLLLTVTDTVNNCSSDADVIVPEFQTIPIVDAGIDTMISCDMETAPLGGMATTFGDSILYEWTSPDGGALVGGVDNLRFAEAEAAGTFVLTVTNQISSCMESDTVVVSGDLDLPVANAGLDTVFWCNSVDLPLNGSGSSTGTPGEFMYQWSIVSGTDAAITGATNTISTTVGGPGTYELAVTNVATNCTSRNQVIVRNGRINPVAEAGDFVEFLCSSTTVQLNGAGSTNNSNIAYNWSTNGGAVITNGATLTPSVDGIGLFVLTVTNQLTGCSATDTTEVYPNQNFPTANAGADATVNCAVDVVRLGSMLSSTGPAITYNWSGPGICTGSSNQFFSVDCPGQYIFEVMNTSNGCTSYDTTMVTIDTTLIEIAATATETVNCLDDEVFIDATGTTTGTNITYAWSTLSVNTIQDATVLSPTVFGAGDYQVIVTDTTNFCQDSATVTVLVDLNGPAAFVEPVDRLGCADLTVSLDASGSTASGALSFAWTATNGGAITANADQAMATGNGAGTYQVVVTDTNNGCQDSTLINVDSEPLPIADAGMINTLPCDTFGVVLDGSASATGATITYLWSTTDGLIAENGTTTTPRITSTGTYILTVEDTATSCRAQDSITVTPAATTPAIASFDKVPCINEAALTGNLPAGTTGRWSLVDTSAMLEDPMAATTFITGLSTGDNRAVWTLSAPGCPDYTSDTVSIRLETPPLANDDALTFIERSNFEELAIIDNDLINAGNAVNVALLTTDFGRSIDVELNADDVLSMTRISELKSRVTFDYEICLAGCPTLCDTATVVINVEGEDFVPNAITPNGDGLNDALVFDQILENPGAFPKSELVVFNRWGNIVFQASPYENDWRGTNSAGENLPQATYYYILRLELQSSELQRGDVTILRQ